MSKFFKYKSAAELEAENARLGIDLRFSEDLTPLFQPLVVGPRTLGNRWGIHPMEGCDGELDGSPGELTFRRYQRFGAGGAKLIWGEACAVTPQARANPRQILLNESTRSAFAQMVADCRKAHCDANGTDTDLLLGLQLTHSGRYSHPHPIIATHDPILDPRTTANRATGARVTADYPLITDDELKRLVDDYVRAAKLAVEVDFDFIDVKQCHRYLLNELLGARNRPGLYGGSYENRTRFAREVFQAVRAAVPAHIVLATRMNVYDGIPFHKSANDDGTPDTHALPLVNGWGMPEGDPFTVDLTEPLRWIAEMRGLGVTLVNVTMGNPYAQPHYGRPFEYPPPDGYESPEHPLTGVDRHFRTVETIQKTFPDLALVGTGYSYLQEFLPQVAAANVRDERVSIVGVGRGTLSQPDWVRQLLDNGKLDRKRVCRTFSYCTAIMRAKQHPLGQYATGCPPFDKEAYGEIWKEVQQLNVKKS
ncbi:nadh:flavin oxidoreductase : NADH:flavin oxidoreductase OS=Planctomyces maris DSM 8797 GN=PM8797T_20134 PE=4 SV=1: Oxidored_FMN [Gemmata massiliana]|uniref:NADH:flavin oxidoreductase/NADH oxidase N-terminal domain-containing protein n=1 Tax=Gemmata massiliana TaxID=1210884 RepID=A0A6P2CSG0_9BACT|nr:NADH:flavin oxidoreductase [Gemmata massiliana]VTR91045.1 nadh:flavin oxidoreductase : NADH:flavin oxidoreductase OS=Planctomyces maris DSM 8797 GN=PM8797T_20134 PE=4 SV=1: Oxidored_FMN [Gemmata massiliana]